MSAANLWRRLAAEFLGCAFLAAIWIGSGIAATSIYHRMTVDEVSDLDLSYTPPLGSPCDAVQMGAHAWTRQLRRAVTPGGKKQS